MVARVWHNESAMKYLLTILCIVCLPGLAWAADPTAASEENAAGLAKHKKKKYAAALGHFQKAVELDPDKHIAHFNAACAASRAGKLDVAKEHAAAWIRLEPGKAANLLYDEDLARLRKDKAWLEALRSELRPVGAVVRPIVFEWREKSWDLWTVGEDGLDRRPLAADPRWREHDAKFSVDGNKLFYRATQNLDLARHYLDPGQSRRRFGRDDDELRVMEFPAGEPVVLARNVQHYRVHEDHVLYIEAPEGMRPRVKKRGLGQGNAETLATMHERSVAWCYAEDADGSLVVASGLPDKWGRGVNVEVTRWTAGEKQVLLERAQPKRGQARFYDFQVCALHDGVMDIGSARVHLTADSAKIEVRGELSFGKGAYNRRRRDSRGASTAKATYVTADAAVFEVARRAPPRRWAASPLMWDQGNGMSEDWWHATRLVRWSRDGTLTELTPKDVRYGDYGPSVAPDGAVAFTRLRRRESPWIVVTDGKGENARLVAPGQYPVWGTAASVREAGASLW